MKKYAKHSNDRITSGVRYAMPAILIGLFMAAILAVLVLNTFGLHNQLQRNAEGYADDISAQLASNISSRMQMRSDYIRNLADTFSKMPVFLLSEELLDRKAEYLEMEEIFVVQADGTIFPATAEHTELMPHLKEGAELYTQASIFFAGAGPHDHTEVFFTAPISRTDGTTDLLVGVRTDDLLQQMLQEVDFENQGMSCIVDSQGTMIVSAEDTAPFYDLYTIFEEEPNSEEAAEIQRMREDIQAQRSGVTYLQNIGGRPMMLGYDFLGINDWILLTLLPADLFSQGTGRYMVRYVLITGLLILGAFLILAYIRHSSHHSLKKIQTVALTDTLTGGMNKTAFLMEGERLLREHPHQLYTILYLNIRNFKRFNQRFGVRDGDQILLQTYLTLREHIHAGELLARTSDDHFFLLLRCGREETLRRLDEMLEGLEERLTSCFHIDRSSIAQGAYLVRNRDSDFLVLLDRARVASTYQRQTETCRFYDDAISRQTERELAMDDSFQSAIENHEFQIYIQPKVRPGQTQKSGGEVLVRWQHPQFGMLFPGDFIPLFELNGKICSLDFYVFEESCKLLKGWLEEGRAVPLSVNLSRAHILSNNTAFLDRLKEIKESYQIPDGLIELELTESLMLERRDFRLVTDIIDQIRAMGFHCSVDDFGFGYSSLSLLKALNINTVKLDRQFFLNENEKSWIVVKRITQLAHDLKMTVVAEGIEDWAQVEQLRLCGCDLIQGYVYAKPMPAADFEGWYAAQ